MLYLKDDEDGYYEFEDDAPKSWYRHLTPCPQQFPNQPTSAEIDAGKDAQALEAMSSPALEAAIEEFSAILTAAGIDIPADITANITARIKGKLP